MTQNLHRWGRRDAGQETWDAAAAIEPGARDETPWAVVRRSISVDSFPRPGGRRNVEERLVLGTFERRASQLLPPESGSWVVIEEEDVDLGLPTRR